MGENLRRIDTDLAIIGTGLAGISASIFALNRNISCALTGNTGALAYTTGYFDLLGQLDSTFIEDPWQELKSLSSTLPNHPLAPLQVGTIRRAFEEITAFLDTIGLTYCPPGKKNLRAITPAGTVKPTLSVPATMLGGVEALAQKSDCMIVGFHGLKGFSALQIRANLQQEWSGLKAVTITFPGHDHGELYPEVAARSLEVAENRVHLAKALQSVCQDATVIGLPAILGIHKPDTILADLERLTGLTIFEIPTMPPSVPGIRLREIVEQILPSRGLALIPQQKVKNVTFLPDYVELVLADNHGPIRIEAKAVLLATGRFLSGGLKAHFDHVEEPLMGLHIHQPASRDKWYREEYLDQKGHAIHLAGIETDQLRPKQSNGVIYDERLFAAGIILAHQDWIRQRCGAGLAIATAYQAIDAVQQLLNRKSPTAVR